MEFLWHLASRMNQGAFQNGIQAHGTNFSVVRLSEKVSCNLA